VLNRRVDLHTIDAALARWRGNVGSSPLDGASMAASSPRNDLVKNCRVHPMHWLISIQVRVMRSVLRLVGDRTLESDLRPICGGGKEEAEEWTLVDRCRRIFAVVQSDTSKGMSAAHYVRFCRNAGLLELGAFAKADLEIMHTQLCAQQEWRANEPAQKLMRWTTFVRALQQLATRAFPDQDVGAAFGRLLDHVHRNAADGT